MTSDKTAKYLNLKSKEDLKGVRELSRWVWMSHSKLQNYRPGGPQAAKRAHLRHSIFKHIHTSSSVAFSVCY